MIKLPNFTANDGPVTMVNLLKYNDKEYYFNTYIPAFEKVTQQLGITGVKVVLANKVIAPVLAPEDVYWDAIVLVEYPSADAFKRIAESELYHEIADPHRLKATKELHLFMTQPM
ncbi:hypothetical protein FMM05_05090 [Flavobacterium zepuense]|uniref:DUF1330 domain-containing protein n=1 Tax=Flavobacterium zepuense TaxID=2593302 RepID=A0A552V8F9_9FLAO|nr:hypothetical protein [Flavobacterium zepuense]TRW26754.1 hypothetical protein FMM05_05090 [Flavobacterium zepuense]